jgi:hypothetical protein
MKGRMKVRLIELAEAAGLLCPKSQPCEAKFRFSQQRRHALASAALALRSSQPAAAAGLLRKVKEAEYQSRLRKARRHNRNA